MPAACQGAGCHNQTNLVPIHTAIGCAGCHESTDPNVVGAIATGNKDCGACHPGGGNHAALHDGGFPPDEDCGLCHNQNLVVQHEGYCSYCHESTDPNVVDAIAAGNTECGACHSTLHGATLTYFDFQEGNGVTTGAAFKKVFPSSFNTTYTIDNGSWALGTATPHSGYSQSTAKCGVCHAVHRAPTAGTGGRATIDNGGRATTSSRYKGSAWTAQATTQMLLKSSTSNACLYCHVAEAPTKMFGGDMTLALAGESAFGWNEFYGHTTGCVSCHAVHGARTFKSADGTVDAKILKNQGVKNLGTIALKIQPEVYSGGGALYDSLADAQNGVLSAAASAAGVTPLQGAVTAQCSICHASYAKDRNEVNTNYLNAELFQPASWTTANGATTKIWVGNAANPVSVLPGVPGLTYNDGTPTAMTGSPGSLIMKYKNHPMKAGGAAFNGAPGASADFAIGQPNIVVSNTGSSACQSCHNAPTELVEGGYYVQSFPHYTPGYYKFMVAQNQAAFDTPATAAEYMEGREEFYNSGFGTARRASLPS